MLPIIFAILFCAIAALQRGFEHIICSLARQHLVVLALWFREISAWFIWLYLPHFLTSSFLWTAALDTTYFTPCWIRAFCGGAWTVCNFHSFFLIFGLLISDLLDSNFTPFRLATFCGGVTYHFRKSIFEITLTIWAFCSGAICVLAFSELITPFRQAFCGGADTLIKCVHGFSAAFCRGASREATSSQIFQVATLWQIAVSLVDLQIFGVGHRNWDINSKQFTQHGLQLTFCRGVPFGYTPTVAAFCGGATGNRSEFGFYRVITQPHSDIFWTDLPCPFLPDPLSNIGEGVGSLLIFLSLAPSVFDRGVGSLNIFFSLALRFVFSHIVNICNFTFRVFGLVAQSFNQSWRFWWKQWRRVSLCLGSGGDSNSGSPTSDFSGKPGPNSGHLWLPRFAKFNILGWLGLLILAHLAKGEGEGRTLAMEGPGAPDDWIHALPNFCGAKQHGTRPAVGFGHLTWSHKDGCVKKRSLQRAYNRAVRPGCAWYRGHCWTPRDFPSHMQSTYQQPQIPACTRSDFQQYNQTQQDGRSLKLLTWNCGGLSRSKLDDIRLWMQMQCLDGLILTETRWKFTSEWSDNQWLYLHSSEDQAGAQGILFMLAKRVCSADQVRWRPIQPGRLIHVQLRFSTRCMDILACYQYTAQRDTQRHRERSQWWDQLDHTLHHLPKRNVLVLAGDFNCSLPQSPGHTGPDTFRWGAQQIRGAVHPDQGQFMAILRAHNLNALNTWHTNLGPTYVKGDVCSRIDYVIVRSHYATGKSKAIQYLCEAPFLSS